VQFIEVVRADDPLLALTAELLAATFDDPNIVLGLDRIQEFLTATTDRSFHVLCALRHHVVVGLSIFSYVPASNCGFSEYIVVAPELRGSGLGRALFDRRKSILDSSAHAHGVERCHGLFIETDTASGTAPAEPDTSMDPLLRLRIFAHLGFKRVDVRYVQPPLAPGKQPVEYLDLLFAPWTGDGLGVPARAVLDTVRPIWRSWAPHDYQPHYARLRGAMTRKCIPLHPLHTDD
jgi:GNAT superfamily N-acetyltransferase